MVIAVVTGASSGIGRRFAEKIAADRTLGLDEIWLVARREERLRELAERIDMPARIFALDLRETASADVLREALEPGTVISVLVNNAGIGADGAFAVQSTETIRSVCDLNVRATTELLSLAAPYLCAGSVVYNLASVAAFLPQPGFSVYAASKAYIYSLSRAVGAEWKRRKIRVVTVCPNPVATEFFETETMRHKTISRFKKLGSEQVDDVVDTALRNGRRGRLVSVSAPLARLIRIAARIVPTKLILNMMVRWFPDECGALPEQAAPETKAKR